MCSRPFRLDKVRDSHVQVCKLRRLHLERVIGAILSAVSALSCVRSAVLRAIGIILCALGADPGCVWRHFVCNRSNPVCNWCLPACNRCNPVCHWCIPMCEFEPLPALLAVRLEHSFLEDVFLRWHTRDCCYVWLGSFLNSLACVPVFVVAVVSVVVDVIGGY